MKTHSNWLVLTGLSALLYSGLVFSETGSALKNDSIRYEPYADAKVIGSFSRGESVNILKKQGAWLQVKTKQNTGWVRLLSVKRGAASGSGNQLSGVLAAANGRAGTGHVVSTTGVRGLSNEDLKAAKFNEAEIKAMENNTVSANQGKQFAASGGLKTVAFANLKAPVSGSAK
jgi:hypothetical protein